ncbi:SIMPL domain-containing protein [Candidatus Micrarchaeota archaeon]|nr:SIMPL domain-containing protein [Candidatus Micrarchaeota archaeon]
MVFGKEEPGLNMWLPVFVFIIVALAGMYVISNQVKPQNFYVNQDPPRDYISVQGEAKTKVAPNLVKISFTVETNDTSSAKAAQEKNSEAVNKIITELKVAGLTDKDIETISFTVQPIKVSKWKCSVEGDDKCDYYDRVYYDELIGYKAVHGFSVKSEDTKRGGALLDAIAAGGGNDAKINSVFFTLKDETRDQLERELLEKASQDARNKAQKIASGLSASLGKVISASESVRYPSYDYYRSPMAAIAETGASKAADTEVFASDIEVTATVSVSFEVS